jgi:hypothetical protein
MGSILGVDLISFPDHCNPPLIPISPEIAARIFQHLVAFASANHEQREPFKHMVSDVSLGGLGRRQFLIKDGFYGPCALYMCGDEWYVVTTLEDISPKTEEQVRNANLKLAQLRDTIKAELFP